MVVVEVSRSIKIVREGTLRERLPPGVPGLLGLGRVCAVCGAGGACLFLPSVPTVPLLSKSAQSSRAIDPPDLLEKRGSEGSCP